MIKPDRTKAPHAMPVEAVIFPDVELHILENGIPVYLMNTGTQDIIKLDLVMEAGQWYSDQILTPVFCSRMLIEGSKKFSHAEIAEKLDYYGTFTNLDCGKHFAQAQLFSLTNFFDKSVEVFEDFFKNPVFPEDKLNVLVKNEMQQYVVSREKTEVLAGDEFIPRIFGKSHPYGKVRKKEDYKQIRRNDLKAFHQQFYRSSNCRIMVSGKINGEVKSVLQTYFGQCDWQGEKANPVQNGFDKPVSGNFRVHKKGAVQSSIMIGKKTINKIHPDFFGLSTLNTILGGYFGSRLMTNLREKNALTYGIYSSLNSMIHAGSFSISASVNGKLADQAIGQIYREIRILKEELIPDEELQMVKNYLAGEMLRAFDGPLALSEIYLDSLAYGMDFAYYRNYFAALKKMNPKQLRELANKYFDEKSFVEVIAGDVNA